MKNYTDINAETWNKWANDGNRWSRPISHEEYLRAQQGELNLLLTPDTFVPRDWYPTLKDIEVLGLASGGGQQMPVLSAHGARCSLLDYSDEQLARDQEIAQQEGYDISIIKGDMTKTFPFADNSFDLIFHPVSNSYVQEVLPIWKECYRVLKKGGILLAGFANPTIYLFDMSTPPKVINQLPFDPIVNPAQLGIVEEDGYQFSHSLETQIGGQLQAGFHLTHLLEDSDKSDPVKDYFKPYIMTRAIKE